LKKKMKLYVKKEFDEDFVHQQLNDITYFSKSAKTYLEKILR